MCSAMGKAMFTTPACNSSSLNLFTVLTQDPAGNAAFTYFHYFKTKCMFIV